MVRNILLLALVIICSSTVLTRVAVAKAEAQSLNPYDPKLSAADHDPARVALIHLNEIDKYMNEQFENLVKVIGQQTYPLIYISSEASLDKPLRMTLITRKNGVEKLTSYMSVPEEYFALKNLSHIPVAVFSTLAPFFNQETDGRYKPHFSRYRTKLALALESIDSLKLSQSLKKQAKVLIKATDTYIKSCIASNKAVTLESYNHYLETVRPISLVFLAKATDYFTQTLHFQLKSWQAELGDDWSKTYFILSSLASSGNNDPAFIIVSKLLGAERSKTQLFFAPTPEAASPSMAKEYLGVMLANRALAAAFFKAGNSKLKEYLDALNAEEFIGGREVLESLEKIAPQTSE